ncbi:hypothetical protein CHLNCDRAFT_133070 [Chlorella variabilis]|uniref:Phosphate transporter n=1 Tax=Chlorella variabilis TaxID=554065 RepID=E1Z2A3_CHLVA|nr:hypothetical protein CHLNCDRAFT_133070 [Chlorella variabilis]EFN59965.1 hypothetical protein CHLNCDRAFT_133070 [Chlorella variabilis]|eukprot:XP_005852067.1 hypothetical protein CHLNCDRAFT_133070 [Chlorella variabilis]
MVYAAVTWIFVAATVLAVFVAYGIGANDFANSFGSSVGSGALTMKQAILMASICEFSGAVLMGSGVTETIRSQIADTAAFSQKPDVLAYGMLCSLLASGIWLILATYWELPVSTTHSIVGAVVGMTMVTVGPQSVNWSEHTDTFPFLGGMSSILLSWLFSPVLTAALSATLFALLRYFVLRSPHAYRRAFLVLPIAVFVTFFMISLFIIQQGGGRFDWDDTPLGKACWISACVGAGSTAVSVALQALLIRRRVAADVKAQEAEHAAAAAEAAAADLEPGAILEGAHDDLIADIIGRGDPLAFGFSAQSSDEGASCSLPAGHACAPPPHGAPGSSQGGGAAAAVPGSAARTPAALHKFRQSQMWSMVSHGANVDIHEVVDTDEKIGSLHYHSERFDWQAESVFQYLQVFTACANSFAHGSNDVANSIGPYAAIYGVWQTSTVAQQTDVPIWILAVGGAGIVLGLATFGYKIMRVLGVKMTRLTNSRGFVMELSAAIIVVISSRFGLPISTTHCLVGAVAGIGLLEGRKGFNGVLLLRFFGGWIATLVVAGLTAAAFTAQGVYSPCNPAASQRSDMADYLINTTSAISALLAGSGQPAAAASSAALNASLAALPVPLLNLQQGAAVQLQALQDYRAATAWVGNATSGS